MKATISHLHYELKRLDDSKIEKLNMFLSLNF